MIYFGVGENNYAYNFGFVFIVIAMLYISQKMRAREKKVNVLKRARKYTWFINMLSSVSFDKPWRLCVGRFKLNSGVKWFAPSKRML